MVNVIIPAYQCLNTLPDTLNSLVSQTKKKFFTTIIQDGDGLDYSSIIKEYKKRGLKISLIKKDKNEGPGLARQTGIDHSKQFDYIMFLDADDLYCPRAVEILSSEISKTGADIISSNFIMEEKHNPGYIMEAGKIPVTWCHGKIYRTDFLLKNNIKFLSDVFLNEDAYFNLVATNCAGKHMKVQEVTYIWRQNKKSLTRNQSEREFFQKGNADYIYGQIKGIKKIIEIKKYIKPSTLGATLHNIYYAMMRQQYEKIQDYSYLDELYSLKNSKEVQDFLNTGENWINILSKVKAADIYEGVVYFYKQRFVDWVVKYIAEE